MLSNYESSNMLWRVEYYGSSNPALATAIVLKFDHNLIAIGRRRYSYGSRIDYSVNRNQC